MKRSVTILFILAAIIYGMQLLIFRDPATTGFYILQDLAFLPISIAVATIVVGDFMNIRDKKERQEKTQMLTSTFFTELGSPLMFDLLKTAEGTDAVRELFRNSEVKDQKSLKSLQEQLRTADLHVHLNEVNYPKFRAQINHRHEVLLVISSNPLLLDHEDFTEMLWTIFHLVDEFRLRGDFEEMSPSDRSHLEADFSKVLHLLLINWSANALYTRNHFPNFYNAALSKLMTQ